jgi:hypothetical protein
VKVTNSCESNEFTDVKRENYFQFKKSLLRSCAEPDFSVTKYPECTVLNNDSEIITFKLYVRYAKLYRDIIIKV